LGRVSVLCQRNPKVIELFLNKRGRRCRIGEFQSRSKSIMMTRRLHIIPLAVLGVVAWQSLPAQEKKAAPKPLRALLVCGGCCHDYAKQSGILRDGIQARANVQVDVIYSEDTGTSPDFPIYKNADWAKEYDIVIHDECAAGVKDPAIISNILNAHKTVPAVNLHCAMHSYRPGNTDWFKFIGLQSNSHGPQLPIAINFVDTEHPITKGLGDWETGKEELYNNGEIFGAHPLALGKQVAVKQKDGTVKDVEYIVAWTNETAGAKSFSTTIGHNNDTVSDGRYLDLVTRGLLWSAGKLSPEYQLAYTGPAGKTTVLPAPPKEEAKAAPAPPAAAKDATPVTVSFSSEQSKENNFGWGVADGDPKTRWCAANGDFPAWIQLEFEKPQAFGNVKIVWEGSAVYQYKVESSADGKTWATVIDGSQNKQGGGEVQHPFDPKDARFVKLTMLGVSNPGNWPSVREISFSGIKALAPKISAEQKAAAAKAEEKAADPYAKEGNLPPSIVKLTPEQEAEILKDVKVPEGFDVSLFASPPAANYPVFIAAAPNGDLYVSSDGNGSLGRNAKRGRILRLRDTDGDGRADQVTEFAKDVDSPRGLVWDHDRLYLVHPPHLSAFIDKDGDGVSDEQKILVKDIAFGFKDRPADHTTNGLSMGPDGWLYIAGGDFGFMNATGSDGKTLQHRNGGVIRVRPDGTGLEIYSTGTRNILEVAISPQMEMFTRDNTNDGGGWNVRFHHFTGYADHGYPRMYKNFNDEIIQPLADYGGGSGCGAVYIDEPGFGEWNDAPFTDDWGTGALWKHTVKAKGATFEETKAPEKFIQMTRPTDSDVDAMSRVYQASWKGSTFNWEGPNAGYIVMVKPKGFTPEPLPNFVKASNAELVKILESPSYRRRIEAQRELMRRGLPDDAIPALAALIGDPAKLISGRTAALFAFTHFPAKGKPVAEAIKGLAAEPVFDAAVARAFAESATYAAKASEGNLKLRDAWKDQPASLSQLNRAVSATTGWNEASRKAVFDLTLGSGDAVVQHTAIQALAKLADIPLAFSYVDKADTAVRGAALRAIAMIHQPAAVDGLIERLGKVTDPAVRQGLLSALSRLNFHEGEWKGDSWGTRPDTRGPYYQPEPWSETPKITAALKEILAKASAAETGFLVKEMNRNRIQSSDALQRILALAKEDPKLLPDAVAQLASSEEVPADAIPLLVTAVKTDPKTLEPNIASAMISNAVIALTKTDSAEGVVATLSAFQKLQSIPGGGKENETAQAAFFESPKLENHHQLLELEAEKTGREEGMWADAALLKLSARKTGSPESRELSGKALDAGWNDVKRRAQILKAVARIKHSPYSEKVLIALDDADKDVAKIADNAAKAMRLEKKTGPTGPLIGSMKNEEAVAQIMKTKGDPVLGEQVFTRVSCTTCHTTKESETQKGPYLGNIAQTYKRDELAMAILDPNKTIAQGFATNLITTKDGKSQMGFVTFESADKVTIRGITGEETSFAPSDITSREKPPMSMMPPGLAAGLTVREFASLLDYLEDLSKK